MLTLEVRNQLITWPNDFAVMMMRYYWNHGVPFVVHRNCIHAGQNTTVEDTSATTMAVPAEVRCCQLEKGRGISP
jgi:hypothetical protein